MPLWYGVASVAAPVVGGIVGNIMGGDDRDAARAAYEQAYKQFEGLNIPDSEKQKLALESPTVQGILQPYMQQAEQAGPSAMEGITTDPRLRQAQMQALDTLSKMGAEGLTAEDKMALNKARRQVGGDEQARQASILQNMAQRGVGGSGMELAAKLSSSQASANRAAEEADRTMAMAQQRMLQGVTQAGQLGGSIRSQEFGEQSEAARAKDLINQFNTQQRAQTGAANIGALNAAQLHNLTEKQRISEAGVGTRNTEQQYNKNLWQQQFQNELALRGAKSNALTGQGQMHQAQAGQTANLYAGIGAGVGQIAGGMAASKAKPADNTFDADAFDKYLKNQGKS